MIERSHPPEHGTTPSDECPAPAARAALAGQNQRMLEVDQLIKCVADTDVTVLIRGERGSGKDYVAREIHAASLRRSRPFVKVNCAMLPPELFEPELFGFERGAFAGAIQAKAGKFEFAHHGTLFLDEIGEVSPHVQVKLLDVLQKGEFMRLGGRHEIHVDVRVLAATSRNLEQALTDGVFREDLFFRLNVVSIALPPLRQRRDDIPKLADQFVRHYCAQYNRPLLELDPETLRLLSQYDWPGNVRELEDLVEHAVMLGDPGALRPASADREAGRPAPDPSSAASPSTEARPATPSQNVVGSLKEIARRAARVAEREVILRTLQQTRWNRRQAAERLGVSYKALLYKIKDAEFDPVL